MKKIPVILDGDPGHDDAICLLMAKGCNKLDIKLLSSVNGNQTIDKTTANMIKLATLFNIEAPISRGASKPLIAPIMPAGNWHGESGLDGYDLPEAKIGLTRLPSYEIMYQILKESKERVIIVATGPLTNVATLLLTHPEIKNKIKLIALMGGGIRHGNWNPASEYNILVDPEAAKVVFNSGIKLNIAPLDATEKAIIKPSDFKRIEEVNNHVAEVTLAWLKFFYKFPMSIGYEGAPVHDPLALLSFINPEIFEFKKMNIDIELDGEFTRGCFVYDLRYSSKLEKNCNVIMNIDREKYIDLLIKYLHYYD